MSKETLKQEDLDAISKLAKDAQSIDDLVTIREMAAEDYGDDETTIRVQQPDGTEQVVSVTEVGRDQYALAHKVLGEKAAYAAQETVGSVEDWRKPKG